MDNEDMPVPRGLLFWVLDEQAPRQDLRTQLDDDDFHKLLWRLHDAGKCVLPDTEWLN